MISLVTQIIAITRKKIKKIDKIFIQSEIPPTANKEAKLQEDVFKTTPTHVPIFKTLINKISEK